MKAVDWPTTYPPNPQWVCPDCGEPCSCDPVLGEIIHVRCGQKNDLPDGAEEME